MNQFNKIFNRELPFIIYFPVILFFIFLLLLALFYPKFMKDEINNYQPKLIQKTSRSNADSTPSAKKTSLPSASKSNIPPYIPPSSGNSLKVPVLFYHYVGNNPNPKDFGRDVLSISPDKFDEQMKYLRDNGYTSISLDTLFAVLKKQATLPAKPVILTFDDGYIDFYYNAYNILRNYGLSATVFVPTGLVGSSYYVTWPQIQEMHSSGLIHFGAHSVHHYNLPSLSPETALNELTESKKTLQDQLGVPINFMAYPNGATSNSVIGLVQKTGYIGAVGTWPGSIQSEGTIYNMPRIRVSGAIPIMGFANLLQ